MKDQSTSSNHADRPDKSTKSSRNVNTARKRKHSRRTFGAIRKLPSGRYQARYPDAAGITRTAPLTFATVEAADTWLATVRADLVRGTWRDPELGAVALARYLEDYLAGRPDLAPRTIELYEDLGRLWLCADLTHPSGRRAINLGQLEMRRLDVATVREWYAAALHTARARAVERHERALRHQATRHAGTAARTWASQHGYQVAASGRLSPKILTAWKRAGSPVLVASSAELEQDMHDAGRSQVAKAYALLHSVLAIAVSEGLIEANPCQIKGAGSTHSAERVPATLAEVDQIAAAMPPRFAAAVHVAAFSGLRAGEVFALARRHVDLDVGALRVERAVQKLRHSPAGFGKTKTPASLRTVHLPPHVVEILRDHLDAHVGRGRDALVFANPDGSILSSTRRTRMFGRARAAADRPDLHWHDLRHTGASLASNAGASLRELQKRLGHSTVAAAMRYQHATTERDRELAARMSELSDPTTNVVAMPARDAG